MIHLTPTEASILGRFARHKNKKDYREARKRLGDEAKIIADYIMGKTPKNANQVFKDAANSILEWAEFGPDGPPGKKFQAPKLPSRKETVNHLHHEGGGIMKRGTGRKAR